MRFQGDDYRKYGVFRILLTLTLAAVTLLATSAGLFADPGHPPCESECPDSCPDCDDCVCCERPIMMIPISGIGLEPADPEPGSVFSSISPKKEITHIDGIDHPPRILYTS